MDREKETILAVDDTPENLLLINDLLRETYQVKVANHGEKALAILREGLLPDLILLDIMMPGKDGYEVLQEIQKEERTRDIPVIFLTAIRDQINEKKGLDMGAADYITKPISVPILLARVRNQLQLKKARDYLKNQKEILEEEVRQRTQEILKVQEVTIRALASLAETRDQETGYHIHRTQLYVEALAYALKENPLYEEQITKAWVEMLRKSAPLHDIGKVGIPDRILLKPGRLDPEEFQVMKTHAELGARAIEKAETQLGFQAGFLQYAKDIAWCHHERWDGKGYPQGLKGAEIPLAGRLMAIADVYDALTSRRIYKDALSHEEALAIILEGRETQFDPDITDAFARCEGVFREIAASYRDR